MKIYTILLFIILSSAVHAQDYDSLKRVIREIQTEQYRLDLHLTRMQEQYSSGTLVLGIGLSVAVLSTIVSLGNDPGPIPPILAAAGGATAATGWIIQMDSHKWIGRQRRMR